jgi:hypothetical protein
MKKRITQIPFPGGSGQTPTGALQFEHDWPGLFIRGDDAISLYNSIRVIEQHLATDLDGTIWGPLLKLRNIADMIERDVIVRQGDD